MKAPVAGSLVALVQRLHAEVSSPGPLSFMNL